MLRASTVVNCLLICGVLSSMAAAQGPPIYQPYGAWRGKIRYVDHQNGIRTRIKWGNGITPTGGQVLGQLITVAGQVASDVAGSGTTKGAEPNPEIASLNQQLATNNQALLAQLNEVRKILDVPPVAFQEPPPVPPVDPEIDAPTTKDEVEAANAALQDSRAKLELQVLRALKIHPTVAATPEGSRPAVQEILKLSALTVIKDDMQHLDPAGTAAPAFADTVAQLKITLQETTGAAKKVIDVCRRLDDSSNPILKQQVTNLKKTAERYVTELGTVNL